MPFCSAAAVFESVVLAAGEVRDCLGRVLAHAVHGHQRCDLCDPQRWRELAQAVVGLFYFALLLRRICIWIICASSHLEVQDHRRASCAMPHGLHDDFVDEKAKL